LKTNRLVPSDISLMSQPIQEAADVIARADALLIGAGAGMGVDSGMPDFRGPEGFWRSYPPYAKLGLRFEEVANPRHFANDPPLGWGFYGHRTNLYRSLEPHDGFAILKKWSEAKKHGAFAYTSNVDHHFLKAGFAEDRIVECHGSIEHWQCLVQCGAGIFPADPAEIAVDPITFRAGQPLPACPGCGGLARPNILMFGDYGWDSRRTDEQEAAFEAWLETLDSPRIAMIEIGAGTAIATVRRFSEGIVSSLGASLIRINVRDPEVPRNQIGLAMGALEALRAIDEVLNGSAE
jgi:NAD-dependent SIR2 family protein deacetylase